MNPLLLVTNASAGSADRESVDAALSVIRDHVDVEVAESTGPDDLDGILAAAGERTVVVAGGDGSVHHAVAAFRRLGELTAERPIGLLPLGTGNDLARTLGLPLDPSAAAAALLEGRRRTLDLLVDDSGGIVVNAAHVGIGALAAERAATLKDRLGAAAYPLGGVVAGATADGWSLRVETDEQVLYDGVALMVAVANGRTIGGGAELAPAARPDDGLLDVVVATSTGPLARLGFGAALRKGDHVERDDVLTAQARRLRVTGGPCPLNTDGEVTDGVSARSWAVEPGAWSVIAPRR